MNVMWRLALEQKIDMNDYSDDGEVEEEEKKSQKSK